MRKTGPAPLVDETEFVPRDLDEARALHDKLTGAGIPRSQARGIVMWLITLSPDRPSESGMSDMTRSRYRKALSRIERPPWSPGRRRSDRGRSGSRYKGACLGSADLNPEEPAEILRFRAA